MTYKPEWRTEDEARVDTLERLYFLDGRYKPDHPQAFTYTGLWEKYKEKGQ